MTVAPPPQGQGDEARNWNMVDTMDNGVSLVKRKVRTDRGLRGFKKSGWGRGTENC